MSGHPLRKSPHESDAEYRARVEEFMADRTVVANEETSDAEVDWEANESDNVPLPTKLAQVVDVEEPVDERDDEDDEDGDDVDLDEWEDVEREHDVADETRAWDTPGERR